MIVAAAAAIAGGAIGWGIATGDLRPAVVAVPLALLLGLFDRARSRPARALPMATTSSAEAGWADVHREIARSRRHERPMTIVRLPATSGPDAHTRAALIAPFLRRIDRAWVDQGEINVLLPETDRLSAEQFVERLRGRRPDAVGEAVSIAAFPIDGLTSGALLASLYGTPLPSVPVPVGVGRPAELPPDVIAIRPHLLPDPPSTDRRESSS